MITKWEQPPLPFFNMDSIVLLEGKQIPGDNGFGRGTRPIINVNWSQALEYCNWLSHRKGFEPVYSGMKIFLLSSAQPNWEGKGFRLPTEG